MIAKMLPRWCCYLLQTRFRYKSDWAQLLFCARSRHSISASNALWSWIIPISWPVLIFKYGVWDDQTVTRLVPSMSLSTPYDGHHWEHWMVHSDCRFLSWSESDWYRMLLEDCATYVIVISSTVWDTLSSRIKSRKSVRCNPIRVSCTQFSPSCSMDHCRKHYQSISELVCLTQHSFRYCSIPGQSAHGI